MTALPAYRHVQPFTMLWVVLPLAGVATGLAAWVSPGVPMALLVAIVGLPLALLLVLGRLVIELDATELRWRFGWLGRPAWRVALAEIEAVEKTRAPATAGSGIRGLGRQRIYNVTIGGPAVGLKLRDGRHILLGTPEPERLAAFIEARRSGRA
jgi:hypothetical protein